MKPAVHPENSHSLAGQRHVFISRNALAPGSGGRNQQKPDASAFRLIISRSGPGVVRPRAMANFRAAFIAATRSGRLARRFVFSPGSEARSNHWNSGRSLDSSERHSRKGPNLSRGPGLSRYSSQDAAWGPSRAWPIYFFDDHVPFQLAKQVSERQT